MPLTPVDNFAFNSPKLGSYGWRAGIDSKKEISGAYLLFVQKLSAPSTYARREVL
jgi:hypothetical protein